MSLLSNLFKRKLASKDSSQTQAVLVYLDGQGLTDEIYEKYDVATLEDQLVEIIQEKGLGEFDGTEAGPEETVLYMYGPDAETLYTAIESTLVSYPLCKNARVVIRYGGPGAQQRETRLLKA